MPHQSTEAVHSNERWYETMFSCRWTLAYVCCFCMMILNALRVNISIAMVCMVKSAPANSSQNVNTECAVIHMNESFNTSQDTAEGDIEWDKGLQGWILSGYFYGYIVTQIPSGYLAGRFGGKRVMLVGLIFYGLSTLLVPFAARYDDVSYQTSAYFVVALRVVAGLGSGVVFPVLHNLWGRWAPTYERSKLNVFSHSGAMIGKILMLSVGGLFCEWQDFDGGWAGIFYMSGAVCLLFCVLWVFVVYDSPAEHPRISVNERAYIEANIATLTTKHTYVPWRSILTSRAVWATFVAHFCTNFGDYTLATKLPAYMKEVLNFDIKSNGLYSSLPYVAMLVVANIASNVIDRLREKQKITTVAARKFSMLLAFMVPAAVLVGTGHIPCSFNYLGVVCLIVAVGFTGFEDCGFHVSPQDNAPQYAGEIISISNTFATIPGIVAPLIINLLTLQGTQEEWQTVFYIWAGIYLFGAGFYTLFASGELQPWAQTKTTSTTQVTESETTLDKL